MNIARMLILTIAATVAASLPYDVRAGQPAAQGYTIEIGFSDHLAGHLPAIDRMEQQLEQEFRNRRHYQPTDARAGALQFSENETVGAEWAGERLFDAPSDYSIERLLRSLVAYNVNRAVPDFRGRIELQVKRLQLGNASIAWLDSHRSFATGRIKITAADGHVLADRKISTTLVVEPTVDRSPSGPELAFYAPDAAKRVGPTLAQFVERALEQAWPERADRIVGPVIVQAAEPNERLIYN